MPEKIILTTCSLNHIAQAKSLGQSVLKYAPDYKLVIGLVDKNNGRVLPDYYSPHEVIEAHELNITFFREMCERYTVLELNCAMKAFFTFHVMEKYSPDTFIFLDSDMLLFNAPAVIENELQTSSIILTPHINSPFPADEKKPREKDILKTGMFNAGFYALRNDDTSKKFIAWWKNRMKDQCYERPKEGLNVDQKWLNFVPFYFDRVSVLRHVGCNAAYWNLHERVITKAGDKFFVNNNEELVFYHFSGYSIKYPELISRHQDRYAMNESEAIKELFAFYKDLLLKNNHEELQDLPCVYGKPKKSLLQKLGFS